MGTTITARSPTSYTQTQYNSNIQYNTNIFYSGIEEISTTITARPIPGDFDYYTWDESTTAWQDLPFTWDTWGVGTTATVITGRTIP